jgi:hypothetical protein
MLLFAGLGAGTTQKPFRICGETTGALTLSGHTRTPSGCKSGTLKELLLKNV